MKMLFSKITGMHFNTPGKLRSGFNNGKSLSLVVLCYFVKLRIMQVCMAATVLILLTGTTHADKASKANKRGIDAFGEQNYEKSVEHFTEALVEKPDAPELKFNRGTALSQLGKTEEALSELISSAAQLDKADYAAAAHFNAGNTQLSANNIEAAIEEYKQAVKLDQASEDYRHNLELAVRKLNQQQQSQEQEQEDSEDKEKKEDEEGDQKQKDKEEQENEEKQKEEEEQSDKSQSPEDGEQEDQNQQPSNQQENETLPMTKEEAQRLLDAINDEEKQALSQRYMQMKTDMRQGDDW